MRSSELEAGSVSPHPRIRSLIFLWLSSPVWKFGSWRWRAGAYFISLVCAWINSLKSVVLQEPHPAGKCPHTHSLCFWKTICRNSVTWLALGVSASGCVSCLPQLLSFETGFLLEPGTPQLSRLTGAGISRDSLHLSSRSYRHMLWPWLAFLCGYWGSELRLSHLCIRRFTDWAISLDQVRFESPVTFVPSLLLMPCFRIVALYIAVTVSLPGAPSCFFLLFSPWFITVLIQETW